MAWLRAPARFRARSLFLLHSLICYVYSLSVPHLIKRLLMLQRFCGHGRGGGDDGPEERKRRIIRGNATGVFLSYQSRRGREKYDFLRFLLSSFWVSPFFCLRLSCAAALATVFTAVLPAVLRTFSREKLWFCLYFCSSTEVARGN